jgi:hypothetical protein
MARRATTLLYGSGPKRDSGLFPIIFRAEEEIGPDGPLQRLVQLS